MPHLKGISPGRHALQRKSAIGIGDSIVRVVSDHKPARHPGVHVAFDPNRLRAFEFEAKALSEAWMRFVNYRIGLALGMDVVHRFIAIEQIDGATGRDEENMRVEPTLLLYKTRIFFSLGLRFAFANML